MSAHRLVRTVEVNVCSSCARTLAGVLTYQGVGRNVPNGKAVGADCSMDLESLPGSASGMGEESSQGTKDVNSLWNWAGLLPELSDWSLRWPGRGSYSQALRKGWRD